MFVSDASLIYRGTTFENTTKQEVKPGLNLKKIVVTTQKLYVFRTLANEIDDVEFRLESKLVSAILPDDKPKEFVSVTGEPESKSHLTQTKLRLTISMLRWSPKKSPASTNSLKNSTYYPRIVLLRIRRCYSVQSRE